MARNITLVLCAAGLIVVGLSAWTAVAGLTDRPEVDQSVVQADHHHGSPQSVGSPEETISAYVSATDAYAESIVDDCVDKSLAVNYTPDGVELKVTDIAKRDGQVLHVIDSSGSYVLMPDGSTVVEDSAIPPHLIEDEDELCCVCVLTTDAVVGHCACYNTAECCCWVELIMEPAGAKCYCKCGTTDCTP